MYNLIYVSSAIDLFDDISLADLLLRARRNNQKLEITGMLLYVDGNFMQIIEGEKQQVLDLFDVIKADKRHTGVIVLDQGEIEERSFDNWSMGFERTTIKNLNAIPGYTDITSENFVSKLRQGKSNYSHDILLSFYENAAK